MDIPKLSMAMSQAKVTSSVNIALIKLAKDQMEQNGEQLVEMLADTGSVIDLKV